MQFIPVMAKLNFPDFIFPVFSLTRTLRNNFSMLIWCSY